MLFFLSFWNLIGLFLWFCGIFKTFFFLSEPRAAVTAAATASAEPQPAAVRAGPAGPSHRNPAAARAVYHLPDATGSAE